MSEAAAMSVEGTHAARSLDDEVPRLPDLILALVIAVFAQLDLHFNFDNSTHYGSDFATAMVVAVACVALAWRRRRPLATVVVVTAALAVPLLFTQLTITLWGHFVPLLVACYSVARWGSRRAAVIGAALIVACLVVLMLRSPSVGTAQNIPFSLVPLAGLFVVGRGLRIRAQRHAELVERTAQLEQLEEQRQKQLAAAIEDERNRIARELHDIVAHCVSVMVVQAGASEDLLGRDPERAREPLRAVQETGAQAVAELHRMLGLLRGSVEDDAQSVLAPQPGTAQLSELVDRMSSLGLRVQLNVDGPRRTLSPGLDLTVYRIVQEALTNTLKHAGATATACVSLRYLPRSLEVEVIDNGAATTSQRGTGNGLVGMTERVAVYGGTIEADERAGGGFRIHVAFPAASR